jgi:Domain of unknown function (DUF4157)
MRQKAPKHPSVPSSRDASQHDAWHASPASRAFAHRFADVRVFDPSQRDGEPLEPSLLERMQTAFGADFGDVRLRVPGDTAQFEAVAMARGNELHFRPGAFDPSSESGLALLGHELAHVVQQRQGRVPGIAEVNADPTLESEADRAGQAAARGSSAKLGGAGGSPSSSSSNASAPVQRVWAKIADGKVQYDVSAPQNDLSKTIQGFTWMSESDFVTFKNAGKRHASNKVTDRTNGKNYYTTNNTDFYTDKDMKPTSKVTNAPTATNLIDRRRTDRTNADIALYDVTTYADAKSHEVTGDTMEHDHVPSGQSRREANPTNAETAYQEALAIEIRGRNYPVLGSDHAKYSPTYGGRQQKTDKLEDTVHSNNGAKKLKPTGNTPVTTSTSSVRPKFDAAHPGAAFYRDVDTMLTGTTDQSTALVTRGKSDQLQQLGAYRYLYKQNLKRGVINPKTAALEPETGYDALDGSGVTFKPKRDALDNDLEQGKSIDEMLNKHLKTRAA